MNVIVFDDPELLARAAADQFVDTAKTSIEASQRFSVALSGGSTPKRVYELLASEGYRAHTDWSTTHIFFGDERCVPADHPDNNYHMAYETMLSRVPIPPENIHPMSGEGDPMTNARAYERELRVFFPNLAWPRFDLIFLGLGEDGHTASLFPFTAVLKEYKAWVIANWVEKLESFRITLSAPAINHAAQIVFLVSGSGKANALHAILHGPRNPEAWPAQLIQPVEGSLTWLVDKAAAASF